MTWTDGLALQGKTLTSWVKGATVDGSAEWTIEGAPTLNITVADRQLGLLRGGLLDADQDQVLDRGVVAEWRDVPYRLVGVDRQPAGRIPLVFEDEAVEVQRRHSSYRRASRDDGTTRAEFYLSLLQEITARPMPYVIPELHRTQPGAKSKATTKTTPAEKARNDAERKAGFGDHTKITVKGHKADAEQRSNLETALRAAADKQPPRLAAQALVVAITQESAARNLAADGILQVGAGTARAYGITSRDIAGSARGFMDGYKLRPGAIELATKHPDWSPGRVAVEVQKPRNPSPGPYQQWADEAAKTLDAFDGGTKLFARETEDHDVYFERGRPGEPEDTWDCGGRLADEVHWRRFVVDGVTYFVSETRLMRSRPRLLIAENLPGVESIEWDIDAGKAVSTATATIRSDDPLVAPPGAVVELADEGMASGRWLVGRVRQPRLAGNQIVLELRQPMRPKKEPAADSYSTPTTGAATGGGKAPEAVRRAWAKVKQIDAKGYRYSYSGGHDARMSGPYDCSGFVSAVLHAAGLLEHPMDTSALAKFGVAGEGKFMTIWVRETGDPHTSHTFMTLDLNQDGKLVYAEAGGGQSGHTGIHRPRSTDGFKPRHPAGV